MAARLRASQEAGVLGPVDADSAAELLVRLAISFVLVRESAPPFDDEERAAEIARHLIAPILV